MFLHREHDPTGPIAISQTSHAWLAWQLAEHWGNRRFVRPAPRAEVLAAILLHDSGWTEFDGNPGIDESGRPVTFDRMPTVEHLEIWRRSVSRAASFSRYAGLLVASHFASLVERKTADLLDRGDTSGGRAAQAFRAEMERLQAGWREALAVDARYQPYLEGAAWEANVLLLAACDRVAVYLCASLAPSFRVTAQSPSGEIPEVAFDRLDSGGFRVQPWPLEGDRLQVHCEGRRIGTVIFSSGVELHETLARAPVERLAFNLARPSAG